MQRLADGLERLPTLAGALALYGELLTDPLVRLTDVVQPSAGTPSPAPSEQPPEPVRASTWPLASIRSSTFTMPSAPTHRVGGVGPTAPARLRTVPASQPPDAHPATASTPSRVVPPPGGRTDRPSHAPPLRLTRDRTTLASLLQANLAQPAARSGPEPLASGPERPDGASSAPWPPEPAGWTSEGERLNVWSGDRPPAEVDRHTDGLGVREADADARPDLIQHPDNLAASAPPLEGPPAHRVLSGSPAPGPTERSTDEPGWPAQTVAGSSGSPGRPVSQSLPAGASAPANGSADAARMPDDALWADPSGPAVQEGLSDGPLVRSAPPAAGGELTVDEILEALADQLELALLRAYGTSGR